MRWGPPSFWGSRGKDSLARAVSLSDFNVIYLVTVYEAQPVSFCTLCYLAALRYVFGGPFSKL